MASPASLSSTPSPPLLAALPHRKTSSRANPILAALGTTTTTNTKQQHRKTSLRCFSYSSPVRFQSQFPRPGSLSGLGFFNLGFKYKERLGFCCVETVNGEGGEWTAEKEEAEEEEEWRGESTMPDRFKPLTKPVPEPPPLFWPWFLAGGLAVVFYGYTWRAVLWELKNWGNTIKFILHPIGQLLDFFAPAVDYYFGNAMDTLLYHIQPLRYAIWTSLYAIRTALYHIQSFYSGIVSSAPVQELTTIIVLASAILSIAEAAVPDSVNSQPYLITFSGIVGYAIVGGLISERLFWAVLLGVFLFGRFVMKKDYVTSALPVAAVVVSVGEPWVRAVALISFTALAIVHHSKHPAQGTEEVETAMKTRKLPLPLVGVALVIGIHVAAKWAGHRHLTWMIV